MDVKTGQTETKTAKKETNEPGKILHWIFAALLALAFAAEFILPPHNALLDVTLLVLAIIVTISAMTRQLPLQNIALAFVIAAVVGGVAHGLSACHDIAMPFGPLRFNDEAGGQIFHFVPWTVPLLWIVALFNSRGLARLMLRPWRKLKSYGYWVIALAAVLMVAFDLALEPFAVRVNHYWMWQPTKISITWYNASLLNYVAWAFVALLILAFATPTLIKKQPGSRSAVDLNPLGIWLGAIILFAVGAAKAALWPAVTVDAVMGVIVLIFAIRGAMW